jgi:membrane protein DedA with SNARE-associated domain
MIEFFASIFNMLESAFMPSNPNGPLVLFFLAVITDIGLPVPFVLDSILILSAYRVMTVPDASWAPVLVIVLALFLGRQVGSGILYMMSRYLGGAFINWLNRHFPSVGSRMEYLKRRLDHWPTLNVVTGRLTPGLLQVTSVAAGTVRLRYTYFAIGIAISSLVYDGILIFLGFIASHSPRSTDINFTLWLLVSMIIVVGILWPIIFVTANRKIKKNSNLVLINGSCAPKYGKTHTK